MSKKIYRSSTDRIISGVCGGLGEYLNIDPSIIRLFWVLLSVLSNSSGILIYIICTIVIPEKNSNVIYYDENENPNYKNSTLFVGIILILVGISLLIKKLFPWLTLKSLKIFKYSPALLIIAGIYILYNQKKES